MTKKELENLVAELQMQLTASKQPTTIRQCWTWCKPYLVPFILGMIVGGLTVTFWQSPAIPGITQTTLEKQAALGGAAIPFQSGNPSPSLSASPPTNSKAETTASLWMNTSEPPLPPNPQADNGHMPLTRLFRPLIRRIR